MPVEVPEPIRFDQDTVHRSYDPAAARTFWEILLAMKPVFESFRGEFIGKCSPVHFFWGSFDLAVTRFSGRPAPARPGADAITREAYSHEVISHGFWPGGGPVNEPAFYAYAAPEPSGLKTAAVQPGSAYYNTDLSEFILPYQAVRASAAPEADLRAFLRTTYDAAATLGRWDRDRLERAVSFGAHGRDTMTGQACSDILAIKRVTTAKKRECETCVPIGARWVHLRTCQRCGVTLCCDSSPNQHASKHARASGHPVIASAEPGERWLYCYPDDAFAEY